MTHHPPDPAALGGTQSSSSSSKLICPICYEDLNPVVEDLQSISVCGHVFHELCLQQWLEYCPAGKKCTCPVCKQSCTSRDVTRLYFQSTGGAEPDRPFSSTQKTLSEAEAEALCGEIQKLQGKLSAVGSALDAQKQHVDELNSEISVWKERAKREEKMKHEHRKERELVHHLLQIKEADLSKTSEECARLQERSLALAKELAALKLAMDVNLGEEEIAKLASIGHGTKHVDAIDVLQKSLFLRNKSYKELMAQCNLLGRGETRTLKKLEKSEEKIKKLKTLLKELEKALEKKDTETLRDMKASKGKKDEKAYLNTFEDNPNSLHIGGCSLESQPGGSVKALVDSDQISPAMPEKKVQLASVCFPQNATKIYKDVSLMKTCISGVEASSSWLIETYPQSNLGNVSSSSSKCTTNNGSSDLDKIVDDNVFSTINPASAGEIMVIDDDFGPPHLVPITNDSLVKDSIICTGDPMMSTRPIGAESANKYAGKWFKGIQTKVTPTMQTSTGSGSLIAVGADGRGGRVKVLRTHDRFPDGKPQTQSLLSKKCKHGTQGGQFQGCLRIEHFFGKMES
uniref:Putative RING finger protein C2A9.04c n=1 Tax=Anthurium amnicola TaxID=1678845 RepID=A0A1D1Y024_9ARAE